MVPLARHGTAGAPWYRMKALWLSMAAVCALDCTSSVGPQVLPNQDAAPEGAAGAASDGGPDAASVCHFPSGRPCAPNSCCTDWCNPCSCVDGQLECVAVYCLPVTTNCDLSTVSGACDFVPCGGGTVPSVVNGHISACVDLGDCLPIPCDPAYSDSCPLLLHCSAASRQCER